MEKEADAGRLLARMGHVPVYYSWGPATAPPAIDVVLLEDGNLEGTHVLSATPGALHVRGDRAPERLSLTAAALTYAIRRALVHRPGMAAEATVDLDALPLPTVAEVGGPSVTLALKRAFAGATDLNELASYARFMTRLLPHEVVLLAARMRAVGMPPQPIWPRDETPPAGAFGGATDPWADTDGVTLWRRLRPRPPELRPHPLAQPRIRMLAPMYIDPRDEECVRLYEGIVVPRINWQGGRPVREAEGTDRTFLTVLLQLLLNSPNAYEDGDGPSAREQWALILFLALCGVQTGDACGRVPSATIGGGGGGGDEDLDPALVGGVFLQLQDWHCRGAAPLRAVTPHA